jgi:hypothetical protein
LAMPSKIQSKILITSVNTPRRTCRGTPGKKPPQGAAA